MPAEALDPGVVMPPFMAPMLMTGKRARRRNAHQHEHRGRKGDHKLPPCPDHPFRAGDLR
jgi:hypothetical protein